MRTITGGPNEFVPHLSVLIAIILSMFSFALLIYFIHHVIRIVQADNVVTALSKDLNSTVVRVLPPFEKNLQPTALSPQVNRCTPISACSGGYLESIDFESVANCARKADTTVEILCLPGEFVVSGAVLGYISDRADQECLDEITRALNIENERSYVQDLEFAFQQLVLVAVRSLSPAINDQLLAITCVDRLCEALDAAGKRRLPPATHRDSDGKVRVVVPSLTYSDVTQMAFSLLGEVSRDNAAVTAHILEGLGGIVTRTQSPALTSAIRTLAADIHRRSIDCLASTVDRYRVEVAYDLNFTDSRRAS